MIFGGEAIGVVAIAESSGSTTYSESKVLPLEIFGTSIDLQSPLYDSIVETSFFNITINVDSIHNLKLSSSETGDLVYDSTEYSNKSYFEGVHNTDFFIDGATDNFFKLNLIDTGPITIVGPPLGGVFPVIPEVSSGGLILGSYTFSQHYTLLLQEFDNTEGKLAINGTSGEIYVISGGGGSGPTVIPQIWIG